MRGSEHFIETDFIDQLYPPWADFDLLAKGEDGFGKQLPPHNLHSTHPTRLGAGEIWLQNFWLEFKILHFSPSPPFVLLIHKVFKRWSEIHIHNFYITKAVAVITENKWQFFVSL